MSYNISSLIFWFFLSAFVLIVNIEKSNTKKNNCLFRLLQKVLFTINTLSTQLEEINRISNT